MLQIIAKLMRRAKPGRKLPNRFGANVFAVYRRRRAGDSFSGRDNGPS
jgi:hypothetical protein